MAYCEPFAAAIGVGRRPAPLAALDPGFRQVQKAVGLKMLRIGWFSTGRGEGSRGLLRFVHERLEDVDARIEFVFSNRGWGEAEGSDEFFRLTEEFGLTLVYSLFFRFQAANRHPCGRKPRPLSTLRSWGSSTNTAPTCVSSRGIC